MKYIFLLLPLESRVRLGETWESSWTTESSVKLMCVLRLREEPGGEHATHQDWWGVQGYFVKVGFLHVVNGFPDLKRHLSLYLFNMSKNSTKYQSYVDILAVPAFLDSTLSFPCTNAIVHVRGRASICMKLLTAGLCSTLSRQVRIFERAIALAPSK